MGHNPYFSRWFSAISKTIAVIDTIIAVTILILVDGFLQYTDKLFIAVHLTTVTILILVDGFLQSHPKNNRFWRIIKSQSLF